MRKILITSLLFSCTSLISANVAFSYRGHDPTGLAVMVKAPTIDYSVSMTLEPLESFVFYPGQDIMAAENWVFRQPDVSYVDRYLLTLPNHNLLPTKNIWLLGHSIRLC